MTTTIKFRNGFFMAPNDIFDMDLKIHEKMVYLYLVRCGNNSTAFPSYNTIADKCSMSRRKAIDVVAALKEMGLLKKRYRLNDHGENMSNIYDVIAPSALRSAEYSPGSDIHAPNKELDYKKLNINKKNFIYENEAPLFSYYSQRYKDHFGKEHPTTNEEKFLLLGRMYDKTSWELDISDEQWMDLVDHHFDNLPKNNNGNILGFLTGNGGEGPVYRYLQDMSDEYIEEC